MYDGMGSECETFEFLTGLVTLIKPRVVFETGTYLGFGSLAIAVGLQRNGFGHLFTAETDRQILNKAIALFDEYKVRDLISPFLLTGLQMIKDVGPSLVEPIGFAFLDSAINTRLEEMQALHQYLAPGGIVAVHDTNTFHVRNDGPRLHFLKYAAENGMQAINFDTPRGLMLLRKAPK